MRTPLLALAALAAVSCMQEVPAVAPTAAPTLSAAPPPLADCLSANEEAIALRSKSQLRGARDKLAVCAAGSCPPEVREECDRRMKLVDAAIPTVRFEARHPAGADISGATSVTIDGQPLLERLVAAPTAVDPGEHEFVFKSDYVGKPTTVKLTLKEGDKDRHERVQMEGGCSTAPRPTRSAGFAIALAVLGASALVRRRARASAAV